MGIEEIMNAGRRRAMQVLELQRIGLSYVEIGRRLQISSTQARNLSFKGRRLENASVEEVYVRHADGRLVK